jgi:hypothetical protein
MSAAQLELREGGDARTADMAQGLVSSGSFLHFAREIMALLEFAFEVVCAAENDVYSSSRCGERSRREAGKNEGMNSQCH